MTLEQVGIVISIIVALLTGLTVWTGLASRLAKIEVKVDTLWENQQTAWEFQLRRGAIESVNRNIGEMNSPLVFDVNMLCHFDKIKNDLIALRKLLEPVNDVQLSLNIERKFGPEIIEQVCKPFGLVHASCLLMAVCVARETNTIDVMNAKQMG